VSLVSRSSLAFSTTDILGFSSAPLAFAELGYGPGVLVYTFFYILAFGAGQIIWRMYMRMDSERFPVKCYADIGERTFGKVVRHIFNILQSESSGRGFSPTSPLHHGLPLPLPLVQLLILSSQACRSCSTSVSCSSVTVRPSPPSSTTSSATSP
jgi:hypothetical protein